MILKGVFMKRYIAVFSILSIIIFAFSGCKTSDEKMEVTSSLATSIISEASSERVVTSALQTSSTAALAPSSQQSMLPQGSLSSTDKTTMTFQEAIGGLTANEIGCIQIGYLKGTISIAGETTKIYYSSYDREFIDAFYNQIKDEKLTGKKGSLWAGGKGYSLTMYPKNGAGYVSSTIILPGSGESLYFGGKFYAFNGYSRPIADWPETNIIEHSKELEEAVKSAYNRLCKANGASSTQFGQPQ
jgi:hypothetical protein